MDSASAPGPTPGLAVYETFTRPEWAALRSNTPLTLAESELVGLRGINESISLRDVVEVYLPLSRLLNLHFRSARNLAGVRDEFLGRLVGRRPYVVAVAGSVAVGKSTFARVLRALLARWPDHPRVALVTTDGFLHPNRVLEERELMRRKGFPESYDMRRMMQFLSDVKAGLASVAMPVYSHEAYDIVPGQFEHVEQPDVLIFEGLNVLQVGVDDARRSLSAPSVVVSDFFDFSIYVDANERDIEAWYIKRFMSLKRTVFQDPASYFHDYRNLTDEETMAMAQRIWNEINLPNLRDNIEPTRERANVVLHKSPDHSIDMVRFRRI